MFHGNHRRVRMFYGAADLILIAIGFQLAYWARQQLHLENEFELNRSIQISIILWSGIAWVAVAAWFEIYDNIESTHPRVILRDTFRQCLLGGVGLIIFEFLWRLDLSRPFVAIFAVISWVLLCLFRLNAGRILGAMRREFSAPHYVMVVGLGETALTGPAR